IPTTPAKNGHEEAPSTQQGLKAGGASVVKNIGNRIGSSAETALAVGVVVIISLLIIPLPPYILDVFLALSLALSVVILLVVLSVRDPIEFNIFPSMLLLITLFRLGLNVSSTRLILSSGSAGQVITAFGDFVVGGNLVVGLVIFLILVVINFVVITKGAGRIAEVAARFTLDAMPGRQMSIDADLGAGIIDETEAKERREEISNAADFYGSMDGAAKFVRGDAVAGIIITAINLVGGFIIGMTQRDMSAMGALTTYSSLTVGDGLVTQIPALVVSTASGMLVTFGSSKTAVASSLGTQLTRNPNSLWTVSGILALFAIIPGLPPLPFLLMAAGAASLAYHVTQRKPEAPVEGEKPKDSVSPTQMPQVQELVTVDPLELEIGYGLVPLVDDKQSGDLLQRVGILRKQLAMELGIMVPPIRIRDNMQLAAESYSVKVRGIRVGGGELLMRRMLALNTDNLKPIDGMATVDPSFGIPGYWINPDQRIQAESFGYTVVDPATVLTTHIMEMIRQHAADLLGRQNVQELLDGLKESHPSLVEDVVPNKVSLGVLHRVLQRLIREGIPIRDLVSILESVTDASEQTSDPELLTEHVRRSLSMAIAQMLGDANGVVRAIAVGPKLEVALMQTFSPGQGETGLEPNSLARALEALSAILGGHRHDGPPIPIITPPSLRIGIRRLIEPSFPRQPVVSLAELPPQTPVETISLWEIPNES
ncbi:MAG: flagellar biosynthesis protein FlhA, partial [Candidatus Eisenbacteria bacterium]|nr:flagellar biosynthesis protein FlhA [Candidatus Eisenbacteria bacterium]